MLRTNGRSWWVLAGLSLAACGDGGSPAVAAPSQTGGSSGSGGTFAGGGSLSTGGVPSTGGFAGGGVVGSGGSQGLTGGVSSGGVVGGSLTTGGVTSSGGEGSSTGTGGTTMPVMGVRAIASPPSYMSNGSSGCNMPRSTIGFEPAEAGTFPLFLYFVGTRFVDSDMGARYDSLAPRKVTEVMAQRGFVALSVDYDNSFSISVDKAACVFDSGRPMSLLSVACMLPNVDCNKGIATWGHSQGAAMAHGASNFDSRIRAVWTTGYSGGSNPLDNSRLRVVNGEADTMNSNVATLNRAAGMTAAECPDDGRTACLRGDGSGWIRVMAADCATNSADHCWFDQVSCGLGTLSLEPNWIDPASTMAWALEANADWVAETVRRP